MVRKEVLDASLNLCPNCGGVWVRGKDLKALSGIDISAHRRVLCPVCKASLSLMDVRGVEIDFCGKCSGVWLDMGEIERLTGIDPFLEKSDEKLLSFRDAVVQTRNVENMRKWLDEATEHQEASAIDDVFLIHNNGCLIAHCTRRLKPEMDDDILSSMLVAVQNFVKDSFKDEASIELKSIDFGEKRILIERGNHVIVAAVVSGDVPQKLEGRMAGTIDAVEKKYGKALEQWGGSLDELRGAKELLKGVYE